MDKERKNRADRTDLMAAGRKMLHQFQKKKDSSNWKNVKKSHKHEKCEEADSFTGPSVSDESIKHPNTEVVVSSVQSLIPILLDDSEHSITDVTNDCSFSPSQSTKKSTPVESQFNKYRCSDISSHASAAVGDSLPTTSEHIAFTERVTQPEPVYAHASVDSSTLPATALMSGEHVEDQVTEVGTMQVSEYSCPNLPFEHGGIEDENISLDIINAVDASGPAVTITSPLGKSDPDYSCSPPVGLVQESQLLEKNIIHLESKDHGPCHQEEMGEKVENIYRKCSASPHSLCEIAVTEAAFSEDCRRNVKKLLIRSSNASSEEISVEVEADEFRYLIKLTELSSSANLSGILDELEFLREQCFISNTSRDFLLLQLSEQSSEMKMIQKELTEALKKNESLSEDIICQSDEIHTASDHMREQMQVKLDSAASAVDAFSSRVENLEMELGKNKGDMALLSSDFAQCGVVVKELESENENLRENLYLLSLDKTQLEIEKDHLITENSSLLLEVTDLKSSVASLQMENYHACNSMGVIDGEIVVSENEKLFLELPSKNNSVEYLEVEICELKDRLFVITDERDALEEDKHMLSLELCFLFEVMASKLDELKMLDPMSYEDNIYVKDLKKRLDDSRVTHFSPKINMVDSELDSSCNTSDVRTTDNATCNRFRLQLFEDYSGEAVSSSLENTFYGCVGVGRSFAGSQILGDTFGLIRRLLKDAENIICQLDIAMECITCHSSFVGVSDGEVSSIKNSESQAPLDKQKLQMKSAGYVSLDDTFLSTKQQIGKLKAVIVELGLHTICVNEMFKPESEGLDVADVSLGSSHQGGYSLEADGNMESEAFSHALNQVFYDIQAMNNELVDLCGTSRNQYTSLEAEHAQLIKKFNNLLTRISKLQSHLHVIRLNFNEVSSTVCYQLENFQKEVDDGISLAERAWMCTVSQISTSLHKLDASVCENYAMNAFPDSQDGLQIASLIDNSVNKATVIIEKLQETLEAAHTEIYLMRCSYADVDKKYLELRSKSNSAMDLVQKVHNDIQELVVGSSGTKIDGGLFMVIEQPHDLSYYQSFEIVFQKLRNFFHESLKLKSFNETLKVEISHQNKEADVLRQKLLDFEAICKMNKNQDLIKGEHELEGETDAVATPFSSLQTVLSSVMRKYKETTDAKIICENELGLRVAKENVLTVELSEIFSSNLISENENFVLKECLNDAKAFLNHSSSELHKKITELEQAVLRLTSVREKLAIAVAKGKGLIVQRDHLRKSLAEASDNIKRLSEDVKIKDEHILLIERKLGAYSESDERIGVLESELSCMHNSTAVLRESLQLNDCFRRIEEIIQEIDVKDNLKCIDFVEKVECFARFVSLSKNQLQKDSFDGVPHSDSTLIVNDSVKQDGNADINNNDPGRYEELQNKIHELAEQNEVLEQSLVDRNNLIQMWENLLNRINAPPQLETMEAEDRIEWFGCAFLEADHIAAMLQLKIENFESYCKSLTSDLDESRRKTSDLETALHEECLEKDNIQEKLELYMYDYEVMAEREMMFEIMAGVMQQGVSSLREILFENIEKESHLQTIQCGMGRVHSMIGNVWQDIFNDKVISFDVDAPDHLEVAVEKLIEKCRTLVSVKASILDIVTEGRGDRIDPCEGKGEEQEIVLLKKYMEDASRSLSKAVEDKDRYIVKNHDLDVEVKALCKRCEELQGLHTLEEQKTASAREKLNVAVRKGKALVQQRDNLKHTVEELNVEVKRHQTEISSIQNSVVQYEERMMEFSTCQGRVHSLEVENLSLRKRLEDMEYCFQEKQHALDTLTNFLDNLDIGKKVKSNNSLDKLEQLNKLYRNLQVALYASQDESEKFREETEFLIMALNKCKDRNSRLVEELGRSSSEIFELTRQKDREEASKLEALSLVEQLSALQSEAKNKQFLEFSKVKSSLNLLIGGISDLKCAIDNVSSKDVEFLHELEIGFGPYLKSSGNMFSDFIFPKYENKVKDGNDSDTLTPDNFDDVVDICDFISHNLDGITAQVYSHKELLTSSEKSYTIAGKKLSGMFEVIQREITGNRELVECMKNELIHMESVSKQKDLQIANSDTCMILLHDACVTSIQAIYNKKIQLYRINSSFQNTENGSEYSTEFMDIGSFAKAGSDSHSEDHFRNTADKLLASMNDFFHFQDEAIEEVQKEMRCTISNLQEVIQDKEIENGKINKEFTAMINEADSLATSYKTQVHNLKCELSMLEEQRNLLEKKVEVAVTGLQGKVKSLMEVLMKKEQEIDALAQALDVEEAEMEELKVAMCEMENKSLQKAVDFKKLETMHAKGLKKLSITVSKFDQLHLLSKHLLTEVEELQSKLHDRDVEVSFLRQEVTRCAKEAITSPINVENSREIHELFWCVYSMLSGISSEDVNINIHDRDIPTHEFKQILENHIAHVISELESLRIGAHSHEKESQLQRYGS